MLEKRIFHTVPSLPLFLCIKFLKQMFNIIISKNGISPKKDLMGCSNLAGLASDVTKRYNSQIVGKMPPKIQGETRHYPPANKEWKNSVYAYNKNNVRSLPVQDKMANKIIKSYFNLSNEKKIARSKRMRNLIRRSTLKRLLVSKPEVKQTNNKVIITVYTFDRKKQFLIRKMYFYNRKISYYNLWFQKNFSALEKTFHVRLLNPRLKKRIVTSRNEINKTYVHNVLNQRKAPYLRYRAALNRSFITFFSASKSSGLWRALETTNKGKQKLIQNKNYFSQVKFINNRSRKLLLSKRNKHNVNARNSFWSQKIKIPYFNLKLTNEINFFLFRLKRLAYSNKLKYIRKLFFFYFLKYTLSLFQTKVNIFNVSNHSALVSLKQTIKIVFTVNNNKYFKVISASKSMALSRASNHSVLPTQSPLGFEEREKNKLSVITRINFELWQFLTLQGNDESAKTLGNLAINPEKFSFLFKSFHKNYFLAFLSKSLKKEVLALNYYHKFILNNSKFGKFLPGLKLLISKIYNKKVELNLVNLKYSHLNSDIYTDSIATKLRKKAGLLKVLRKSLKLVKTPYEFYSKNNEDQLNKFKSLNIYKALDVKGLNALAPQSVQSSLGENSRNSEDVVHVILGKLFPYSLAQGFSSFRRSAAESSSKKNTQLHALEYPLHIEAKEKTKEIKAKNISVLNLIKYKWVTGVRLEAAGRLTRRYTASRSVFKFRYKGNLKNIDYSLKTDSTQKNVSTVMLRNHLKPNSQYTFVKSKRRIGAFGIKGWISSY